MLAEVYRLFAESGEWPRASRLQRDIDRRGERLDVIETSRSLTDEIQETLRRDSEVRLTLEGLSRVRAARADLGAFLQLVHMAFQAYLTSDSPRVTSSVAAADMGLTPLAVKRLLRILEFEPPFAGGSSSLDGTEWDREVSGDARHFRNATSITKYLRIKRRLNEGSRPEVYDPGYISRWASIEARLAELKSRLPTASTIDDFQEIGRRTREIVAETVLLVTSADPQLKGVGTRDAKQRLRQYLGSRTSGATWARLEDVVRSLLALANAQTHATRPLRAAAFANVQVVATLVRILQMVEAELWAADE